MNPSAELLDGCLSNDRKSQHRLYNLCYSFMMGVCLRYAGNKDDARALVNAGFLKIILNMQSYQRDIPFEAWVRTILVRTSIDEFRKNQNYKTWITQQEDFSDSSISVSGSFNEAENKLNVVYIEQCLNRLPPVSKQVFNLFAIDGYPHKEIALMLGISEGTSKWHVNFARQKLKEMILDLVKKEGLEVYAK